MDENKYMIRDITVDSLAANGRKIDDLTEYTDWKGIKDDGLTESFQRGIFIYFISKIKN